MNNSAPTGCPESGLESHGATLSLTESELSHIAWAGESQSVIRGYVYVLLLSVLTLCKWATASYHLIQLANGRWRLS